MRDPSDIRKTPDTSISKRVSISDLGKEPSIEQYSLPRFSHLSTDCFHTSRLSVHHFHPSACLVSLSIRLLGRCNYIFSDKHNENFATMPGIFESLNRPFCMQGVNWIGDTIGRQMCDMMHAMGRPTARCVVWDPAWGRLPEA